MDVLGRAKQNENRRIEDFQSSLILSSLSSTVPTTDEEVTKWFMGLDEPIIYFGEDIHARRQRLKKTLLNIQRNQESRYEEFVSRMKKEGKQEVSNSSSLVPRAGDKLFYTRGSEDLKRARVLIYRTWKFQSTPAIPQNPQKLEIVKDEKLLDDVPIQTRNFRNLNSLGSLVGDSRPIGSVCLSPYYNPTHSVVAIGGWSGSVSLHSTTRNLKKILSLTCSENSMNRCHAMCWQESVLCCGFSSGEICMWTIPESIILSDNGDSLLNISPRVVMSGDRNFLPESGNSKDICRVTCLLFHPHIHDYLFSSYSNGTWNFFDISRSTKLLTQEGHYFSEIHDMSIHPDGSLLGTSDSVGNLRIWDLRTGKCSLAIEKAHTGSCTCFEFSPDKVSFATGGSDNVIRIFDMRRLAKNCLNSSSLLLLAHEKVVSSIKWVDKDSLVSTSYDCTVKIWEGVCSGSPSSSNSCLNESKILCADLKSNGATASLVTGHFDRTFKLFNIS